jgi:hypothetical protein
VSLASVRGIYPQATQQTVQFSIPEPTEHLLHTCPADAKITGKRGPALELAGVEKRLVISGEVKRIVTRL